MKLKCDKPLSNLAFNFNLRLYNVAQVALGAARLLPSARYAPLRLRLIRVLNALSAATGHFVPVAPLLLELLAGAHTPPLLSST